MQVVEVLLYITLLTSLVIPLLSALGYNRSKIILAVSLAGVLSFLTLSTMILVSRGIEMYSGLVRHDMFTSIILVGAGLSALIALITVGYDAYRWFSHPAFYSLLPLILFGVFFLAGAGNVLVIVAAWLLVSIASYVFIALPGDGDSRVAAVRYIYVGIVATLLVALWAAIHVSTRENGILEVGMIGLDNSGPILALALVASLAAFGFKLGVVPFHWWLPSVYGRADGRVVAVIVGMVKLGFIALIVRLVAESFAGLGYTSMTIAVIAVLTMTYGNIAALTAMDLQRLLAYSSIAHIGYITGALYVLSLAPHDTLNFKLALAGIALQSVAYTIAKTPLLLLVSEAGRSLEVELRGLLARDRISAISTAVLLASLLGVPPLLGFWGKLYMFLPIASCSILLLLIALINSGISSAYYIRALRNMVTQSKAPSGSGGEIRRSYRTALLIGAIITILLGLLAPLVIGFF